jgi:hypothetical protein
MSLSRSLSTAFTLNGWIDGHEVESPDSRVWNLVVTVVVPAVFDVALEAVHGKVEGGIGARSRRFFSTPQIASSAAGFFRCSATMRADCTNMPPEPQAGAKPRPWKGSMTSVSSRTTQLGV